MDSNVSRSKNQKSLPSGNELYVSIVHYKATLKGRKGMLKQQVIH